MVRLSEAAGNPHETLSSAQKRRFQALVRAKGRAYYRDLPWRHTRNPYRILVSEIMLQQTQAPRVIEKYRAFLRQFPSIRALARASLRDVLIAWQGLGYNRRARALHESARAILDEHRGRVPREREALEALPGIGPYTAAAVRVFAYNEPEVLIETNVREVFLHHFFADADTVADRALTPLVEAALDTKAPSAWYTALFDYGAHLKQSGNRAARRSASYARQGRFEGSSRQLRGRILATLAKQPRTLAVLAREVNQNEEVVEKKARALEREGLVTFRGRTLSLPASSLRK